MTEAGHIPLTVLTGFLGSGKTTLLRHALADERFGETAVVVNEFGAVGIDQYLLSSVGPETVLLDNGCICCAIRGEIRDALLDLFARRERGEIPPFRRVVLETTGLAEPAPIVSTLLNDPVITHHFRLHRIVAAVDGVDGGRTLAAYDEAVEQVAAADQIVITKCDMAPEAGVAALEATLAATNPAAERKRSSAGDPAAIIDATDDGRPHAPTGPAHGGDGATVHTGIASFTLTVDRPLDWTAFGLWLSMLINRHGDRLLRIKGVLDVAGFDGPVLVNGVQHQVHPPQHLEAWPEGGRRSEIVFIVRDLDRDLVASSLHRLARALPRRLHTPSTEVA